MFWLYKYVFFKFKTAKSIKSIVGNYVSDHSFVAFFQVLNKKVEFFENMIFVQIPQSISFSILIDIYWMLSNLMGGVLGVE